MAACVLYMGRNKIPRAVRRRADATLHVLDDTECEDTQTVITRLTTKKLSRRRKAHIVASHMSREVRAKFGFKVKSEANELVAHKYIYDHISLMTDMRRADVASIVPLAVMLSFIPSSIELESKQMEVSQPFEERRRQFATAWHDGWSIYRWLGLSG